jgi:catechol 2,3-dioxygenase-like lactoylglutathione lyase family enzyme
LAQKLGLVALVVPDYQAGLDFFVGGLGFEVIEDRPEGDKRWIVVRPVGAETGLVLARAVGAAQKAVIGNQTGGRVGFFCRPMILTGTQHVWLSRGVFLRKIPATKPMAASPYSAIRSETVGI